jgi:hypothetical protein
MASEANTASAVGMPSRWCCSSLLARGLPTNIRLSEEDIARLEEGTEGGIV